uniref:Uncharacterized protein n=1 Tax=Siphoviridae sp. ctXZx16 TaxID=2826371 RepID=A0A8S5MKR9_9CAUD|nr:MAG TPA: hypothetical protein [Siphoviridae sp. ctXZx16]DAO32120.1 MAG TPA: hypothetical protein [Caudoviricetes sp.]
MALFLSYIGRGKLSIYYLKTHIAVQRYEKDISIFIIYFNLR